MKLIALRYLRLNLLYLIKRLSYIRLISFLLVRLDDKEAADYSIL